MEWLAKALEKNKALNVVMFFITLLGTVITIILGWKQFYVDYLSHEVSIPVWTIFLVLILAMIFVVAVSGKRLRSKSSPLEAISGQNYGVQRINAGGKRFVNCRFQGTQVILSVTRGLGFEHCSFDRVHFTWGEDESVMMLVLARMYADPAFRPLIEEMFDGIRTNNLPEAPTFNEQA